MLSRRRRVAASECLVCAGAIVHRVGYGRPFAECTDCGFIFTDDYDASGLGRGMGMEGSWSGPGGGGYREYYLVKLLRNDLALRTSLLFGTGNTATLGRLLEEGFDSVGVDISPDVVAHKKEVLGDDRFFTPSTLPDDRRFDVIVAVEVFEHLTDPHASWQLLANHLEVGGILCGTTNFYPGGPIEDGNDPGYMSHKGHVAYWSERSLGQLAKRYGFALEGFEMVRPGSVLPDERYGQLWPNKRVFFVFEAGRYETYFQQLRARHGILPIDRP